jgi:TPR repeat protein
MKSSKITVIIILAVVVAFVLYYTSKVVPKHKAEQILKEQTELLDNSTDKELYGVCERIIQDHDIPQSGNDSLDISNLVTLTQKAWKTIETLANEGNADAQYMYALRFSGYKFSSHEWVQDKDKNQYWDIYRAAYWFLRAAKQGHVKAQSVMGQFYYRGYGVYKCNEMALYWTKLAAEQGDTKAQDYLGYYYRWGLSNKTEGQLEPDPDKYWMNQQLNPYSYGWRDHMSEVPDTIFLLEDASLAKYWWRKAADKGDQIARANLEQIF